MLICRWDICLSIWCTLLHWYKFHLGKLEHILHFLCRLIHRRCRLIHRRRLMSYIGNMAKYMPDNHRKDF
jgi:hypothetical protein